ncbi:MAG: hypothetical protein B7Z43_10170 [Sphingomonas sp. 12-62-6]|nr:MAG: hypothetical protein B7Z43_10170 [Sphingomonas sp. 12-62-6]
MKRGLLWVPLVVFLGLFVVAGYALIKPADRTVRSAMVDGDPFERIGDDPESAVQLALGSAGVPETFVIDGQGKIILQHVGEIRDEDVPKILEAMGKSS